MRRRAPAVPPVLFSFVLRSRNHRRASPKIELPQQSKWLSFFASALNGCQESEEVVWTVGFAVQRWLPSPLLQSLSSRPPQTRAVPGVARADPERVPLRTDNALPGLLRCFSV